MVIRAEEEPVEAALWHLVDPAAVHLEDHEERAASHSVDPSLRLAAASSTAMPNSIVICGSEMPGSMTDG